MHVKPNGAWRLVAGVCVAVLIGAANLQAQETGWGKHKKMYAVPVPGKVTVDAKLDEWDLSAQIEVYVMKATREVQSGTFAVMYDDEALYLGGVVRDPSPMMNRHAPEAEGNFGWDADACQFRLVLDPKQGYPVTDSTWKKEPNDQLVQLILWYYTDRQEPNVQAVVSMAGTPIPGSEKFGVLPKDKFQAAYRLADDKRGYSFEYRIPWSTLGNKTHPKAGDVVAATMQYNWSRPDGLKTAGLSGWGYDLLGWAGFAYQNAGCWGKLIFSKEGKIAKELVEEGLPPEKPLPLTFEYDLPTEAEVTITLFNEKNEAVRTLAAQTPRLSGHAVEKWDGMDDLDRPLPPGKYVWKGLYHQPLKWKYVLSVHNSGQPAYKNDAGTGGWGADHGPATGACAVGDDMILSWISAETGWGLLRTNSEGRKKWGSAHDAMLVACDGQRIYTAGGGGVSGQGGVRVFDVKDCRPMPLGNGASGLLPPPDGDANTNQVTGMGCAGGHVYVAMQARNFIALYDGQQGSIIKTWDIPSPGVLAARSDGSLVGISDGKLVSISDGEVTALASDHLDMSAGVAVDKDGSIYVSNGGSLQNVSVFAPDGKYLRSIGKTGGRPRVGRFDPAGMLQPKGLAVDAKGRLWVAESIDSPKRFSVWDTKTGVLAKEFFGGAHYSAHIWMDREHPDEVYCDGVLWKVDLDKGTWAPYSSFWRPSNPNSPGDVATHFGGFQVLTAKNGRQYGWSTDGKHSRVLYLRDGDIYKPLLAFIWTKEHPAVAARYPTGPAGATLVWVDQNDDQTIQDDELSAPIGPSYFRGFAWIDADLNLWHAQGKVYRPLRIEADGRPVYDFTKPEAIPAGVTYVDDQDGTLYRLNPGKPTTIGYSRCTLDGKLMWGYFGAVDWPKALSLPPQRAGALWGPTAVLGTAGDFTGFNTYFGVMHVYTRDGLCVSTVLPDSRTMAGAGADTISCENGNGQLVQPKGLKTKEGADRYFVLGGDQDGRVTEVFGLETVKRLPGGEYALSETDAAKAAQAYAEYQSKLTKSQRLTIVRGRKALEGSAPVGKTVGPTQGFQARAAYDEQNLYVLFDISSPTDLVNGMTDTKFIFKGGNLLDIQLGTDPQADPQRKEAGAGDLRILVSQQKGKPVAVIYRAATKGTAGEPIVLKSPTGQTTFAAIETTDKIGLTVNRTNPTAFTALVTIPLDVIGWKPVPGSKLKMDMGYVFGAEGGLTATRRVYWTNNGFSANVLNDVPNESKLEPQEWGEANVE